MDALSLVRPVPWDNLDVKVQAGQSVPPVSLVFLDVLVQSVLRVLAVLEVQLVYQAHLVFKEVKVKRVCLVPEVYLVCKACLDKWDRRVPKVKVDLAVLWVYLVSREIKECLECPVHKEQRELWVHVENLACGKHI